MNAISETAPAPGVHMSQREGIRYYPDVIQGSDEWKALRLGRLTASEMHLIVTPTLKPANNDKERTHMWELLSQRITREIPISYMGEAMMRGVEDEVDARNIYHANYAPVEQIGFITSDEWGFTIGYSPDGLVGDNGLIEVKSRLPKFQVPTIIDNDSPSDFMIQIQTGLLVSRRKWVDFISYSAGLPMLTVRVFPDLAIQEKIIEAATVFEAKLDEKMDQYIAALTSGRRLLLTERRVEMEMFA